MVKGRLVRANNHTLSVMMRYILLSFLVAFVLVAASPAHQIPRSRRGTSSKADGIVNGVSKAVYHVTNLLRRQEQVVSGADNTNTLRTLSAAQQAAVEQATRDFEKPFGNAAIWREAIDFDKERGNGHENRDFYQTMATLQEAENSSRTIISPFNIGGGSVSPQDQLNVAPNVAKALQYIGLYPAQLKQSQASDPARSLGKFGCQRHSEFELIYQVVQLSPEPQQTIASFGGSGAWWPNFLKDFPLEQQQNLSTLLFSEDWLHLSGYRHNLGGSGGLGDSVYVSAPGRGVESFMTTNGSYDYTRDAGGSTS